MNDKATTAMAETVARYAAELASCGHDFDACLRECAIALSERYDVSFDFAVAELEAVAL